MSVYNGDNIEYVKQCVQSICAQTFSNFEVVLIDDGITKKELQEYISTISLTDSRFKIYRNKINSGLAVSMNNAIKEAKGKYYARMDADDLMYPDRLQKQYDFLERNPEVDIVGSFYVEINDQKEILNKVTLPVEHKKMIETFPRRNPLAHVSVMMRKKFLEKSGLYPVNTYTDEDTLMWLNGIKNGATLANIPEYLLKVRVSNNFYKRRGGYQKAIGDLENRLLIIRELKLSKLNYTYVVLRFLFQLNPFSKLTYLGYKYLRK